MGPRGTFLWIELSEVILKIVLEAKVAAELGEGDGPEVWTHRVAEVLDGAREPLRRRPVALAGRAGVWRWVVGRELDHRGARLEGQGLQDLLRGRHLCGDKEGETGLRGWGTHLCICHLHQTQPYVHPTPLSHLLYFMYSNTSSLLLLHEQAQSYVQPAPLLASTIYTAPSHPSLSSVFIHIVYTESKHSPPPPSPLYSPKLLTSSSHGNNTSTVCTPRPSFHSSFL